MSSDLFTLYVPLVLVLAAIGQPLVWRVVVKGRWPKRCPACAYSFVGLKSNRCPECGQRPQDVAFGPLRFFPTRLSRQLSLLLIGLAVANCLAAQFGPSAVVRVMPTSTLWVLRYFGAAELAGTEIVDRYLASQLREGDYRYVPDTLVMSDGRLPNVRGAIALACESALRGDADLRALVVSGVDICSIEDLNHYITTLKTGKTQGLDISWIVTSLGDRFANENTSSAQLFPFLLEMGKDATPVAAAATKMLSSEQQGVQYAATQLLAQMNWDDEAAVQGFKLAISDGMAHRYDAAEALGRRDANDVQTMEFLSAAISDDDPRMRRSAARALKSLVERDSSCVLHVVLAMGDPDTEVKDIAVRAIITHLRQHQGPGVNAVGDIGIRACAAILRSLKSEHAAERLAALIAARRVRGCNDEVRNEVVRISTMNVAGLSEEAKSTLDAMRTTDD